MIMPLPVTIAAEGLKESMNADESVKKTA